MGLRRCSLPSEANEVAFVVECGPSSEVRYIEGIHKMALLDNFGAIDVSILFLIEYDAA